MTKARHRYRGELARPLRPGETADTKLPALLADLVATSDKEAVIAMLVRHVVGLSAHSQYPLELRCKGKAPDTINKRLPLLYAYLGVSDYRAALLALAARHVAGFRQDQDSAPVGGRPALLKPENAGWLCEIIDDMLATGQSSAARKLTVLDCAKRISAALPGPDCVATFYGTAPKKLVEIYSDRKRADRQFIKQMNRTSAALKNRHGI